MILAAMVLAAPGPSAHPLTMVSVSSFQLSHPPIRIEGNSNFTASNGVVAGSGTQDDPYLIVGWQIDASTANAIEVRDTTAHFVIRDIEVAHSSPNPPAAYAVFLQNVTDAAIRHVNVSAGASGFYFLSTMNVSVDRVRVDSSSASLIGQGTNLLVSNSTFNGGWISASGKGIRFLQTQASGIAALGARDIVIDGNSLEFGGRRGQILLNWTENALVSRNVGVAEILTGWAGGGNNTRVIGNDVSGGAFGIKGYLDRNLTVADNNVSSQSFAAISLFSSSTIQVYGNRIANSFRGMYLRDVTDLLVAQSDFDSNSQQVEVASGQRLEWNQSYPIGGNRWSDYTGTDLCSGPQQDVCLGPDGIGDTPYVIDANNADHLPLMAAPTPPSNIPPHAGLDVAPESGNTSTVFTFDASSSWDAQDPSSTLEVRWDWQSDGVWDTNWSTAKIATHQFPDPGTYAVRLEVRDTAGLTGNTFQTVLVTLPAPATLAVTITASRTSGTMPLTVSFTSDVLGGVPPYNYHWEFGDGSTSNAADTVHIYVTGGNFTIWLNVYDSAATFAQSGYLFVNVTPAAVGLVVTPPTDFFADSRGVTVTFTATVTGGTPPYTYQWNFGDGGQSATPNPTHTYPANGTYGVSLTVTDSRGQSVTRTLEFVVPPPSTPPSGVGLTPFVLAASIGAAVLFAALWLNERRKGRSPPGPNR